MRWSIFSQWIDLRTGVMCEYLGMLATVCAEVCLYGFQKGVQRVTVVEFGMYDRSGDGVGCYTRQKVQQNRPKSLQIFNRLFLSSLKAYSSLSYHHQLLPNNEWSNSRRWAFCLNLFVDWFVSITGKVTNVYETFGGVGLERRKKQPIRYWEWSRPILLDFLPCVTVRSKSFTIQVHAC